MQSVLIQPLWLLVKIVTKGLWSLIIVTGGSPIIYCWKRLNAKSMARASKSSWGKWLSTDVVALLDNATGLALKFQYCIFMQGMSQIIKFKLMALFPLKLSMFFVSYHKLNVSCDRSSIKSERD